MQEAGQPVLAVAIYSDASHRTFIAWRRWDPVTGRQLLAGTHPAIDLASAPAVLQEIFNRTPAPPARAEQAQRPAHSPTELDCGCLIARNTDGPASLVPCDRHREHL